LHGGTLAIRVKEMMPKAKRNLFLQDTTRAFLASVIAVNYNSTTIFGYCSDLYHFVLGDSIRPAEEWVTYFDASNFIMPTFHFGITITIHFPKEVCQE
jgi:hypothetical protein